MILLVEVNKALQLFAFLYRKQYTNHMSQVIVLNPEEKLRLDYEHNWKDLVTYEDYLDIIAQTELYLSNALGYEASK